MSSQPQLSVIQLSLADTTFEEDLESLADAGVRGVGIVEDKLRAGEEAQQLAALRASGLTVAGCVPAMSESLSPLPLTSDSFSFPGSTDVDERVAQMCKSVQRLAPFGPDSIAATVGSSKGYSSDDARRLAAEGLAEVARVAAENGTRIALEPCRDDLGAELSFLRTIPETIAFLDEVGSPALGLCYDVYHLWDTEGLLAHTERHADRIFSVQYADYRVPRAMFDRLLPGDGMADFPGILGALEAGGFTGWYELEVMSDKELPDSLWNLRPSELLERGQAAFHNAWDDRRRP